MIVDCAVYEEGERRAGDLALAEAGEAAQRDGSFVWIGVFEPSAEEFDAVRREFDLHELAVEDAVKAHQRPKAELYGDTLLVVLKTVRQVEDRDDLVTGEILLFVNRDFVVSVRHGEAKLHDVRLEVEKRPDLLRMRRGSPSSTRSSTASSTTTSRSWPRSRRTSRRSSTRSSRLSAATRPSGSTRWSARCSTCTARSHRSRRRSTSWRAASTR